MAPTRVEIAEPADAGQLADILFRAFANDGLVTGICYPDTAANRRWWARMIENHMGDPSTKVYKVFDGETGSAIAWAKWLVQHQDRDMQQAGTTNEQHDEKHGAVDPDDTPSKDMNVDACRKLATAQYEMRQRVLGDQSHWWLNAIATDPGYQRRGAASLLVAEGCKLADSDGLDIFSACTTQANQNMSDIWIRHGFDIVDKEPVAGGFHVFAGLRRGKHSM